MNLSLSERKPTAEDLIYEEAARAWREDGPEFKRLKRMALDLGIATVIVTLERTIPWTNPNHVQSGNPFPISHREGISLQWLGDSR